MRRIYYLSLLIGFLIYLTGPKSINAVEASSGSDLLTAVNALRTNNGLTPYEVDSSLMASAQQHAEYMAEIGEITHTREDGSTPSTLGFIENIAGGMNLTVDVVIYSMWTDVDHWNTMVGINYGVAGAGAAEKDGVVYYVLQVKRIETGLAAQPTPDLNVTADPNLVSPVFTVTPQIDGSVIHEVLDGQSLWSIALAYGVTIADIIQWNNLAPTPVIFPGERLIVQPSPTPTMTPTITNTPLPSTRTPTATVTPTVPTNTPTITLTPTITPKPPFSINSIEPSQRKTLGIGVSAICALGLVFVIYFGFIRKK